MMKAFLHLLTLRGCLIILFFFNCAVVKAQQESDSTRLDFDAVFTFAKNENNKVFKFISHENGKDIELKKVN